MARKTKKELAQEQAIAIETETVKEEKENSMKDGWHVVRGLEVYIENGLVIRGIKTDSNGGRVTAYLYRKARGGGWNKDEGMTVAALKAGLIRGSIALK